MNADQSNLAQWKITFKGKNPAGLRFSAYILDMIEDKYFLMYICEEGAKNVLKPLTHRENACLFTRDQFAKPWEIDPWIHRSQRALKKNNLRYVRMPKIDNGDCWFCHFMYNVLKQLQFD